MRRVLCISVFLFLTLARLASAGRQEVAYLGTVIEVEASRILVNVTDEKSKKEDRLSFAIDRDTKIKRDDSILSFVDAKITKGERLALLVDPAAKTKMLAMEIRLAATP